jgi:hypothetical protein
MKQNMSFNVHPPSMFVFYIIAKIILWKVIHRLRILIDIDTKFCGPTLTGVSSATISEV